MLDRFGNSEYPKGSANISPRSMINCSSHSTSFDPSPRQSSTLYQNNSSLASHVSSPPNLLSSNHIPNGDWSFPSSELLSHIPKLAKSRLSWYKEWSYPMVKVILENEGLG
jgi:hypothetical protein